MRSLPGFRLATSPRDPASRPRRSTFQPVVRIPAQAANSAWHRVIPFFAFPPVVRRVVYTTNAIESIRNQLRKIIKTRGHFPSNDAASKFIWLALRSITADWGVRPRSGARQ